MGDQDAVPDNAIIQAEDEEFTYFVCQTGNQLTERVFDGELGPPKLIASAKPDTPGTYLLIGDQRELYCLSEGNILQNFVFDDQVGKWAAGGLANLKVEGASDAEIAATITANDRIYVFFQSPSGTIQSVYQDSGKEWRSSDGLPSTQPSNGLSIFAIAKEDTISLFYTNADGYIHELSFDEKWTDVQVPLTHSTSKKHSIAATPAKDGEYTIQYTTAEGELYAIHKGEKILMGKYVNGVFKDDKDAQGWNYWGPRVVYNRCGRRGWW